jgi:pimeloyl-ACP methyl ester carboxylesterase
LVNTELLSYRDSTATGTGKGTVEYAVYSTAGGADSNTTLFLHGLAGSIDDTRPLASGIRGTKVFAHLPGHGRSTSPAPQLTYDVLAEAARAVADHTKARCALGVSLGAATLLRILTETPDRFERVVLYLPAVADQPRSEEAVTPHRLLAKSWEAGDVHGVTEALLLTQPLAVRTTAVARVWAQRRARELLADGGDPHRLLPLASAVPLDSLDTLRAITVPVLVIAQEGDPAHPVAVARRICDALPAGRLEVFDAKGALWGHRNELRALIAPFIDDVRSVTKSL